jgi:hypothetical protein
MPNCASCPPPAQKIQTMANNILANHPGVITAYAMPFNNTTTCSRQTTSTKHEASKAIDSIILRYKWPMKDQGGKIFAVAGSYPICGMNLEKIN